MPTPNLNNKTTFELLFYQTPNYNKLKVFGFLCYPWLKPYNTGKLQQKSKPCVFLGYSTYQRAYICFENETKKMYVSRHVRFIENIFPFASNKSAGFITPQSQNNFPMQSDETIVVYPYLNSTRNEIESNTSIVPSIGSLQANDEVSNSLFSSISHSST